MAASCPPYGNNHISQQISILESQPLLLHQLFQYIKVVVDRRAERNSCSGEKRSKGAHNLVERPVINNGTLQCSDC